MSIATDNHRVCGGLFDFEELGGEETATPRRGGELFDFDALDDTKPAGAPQVDHRDVPEWDDAKTLLSNPPVLICGSPRSGTTMAVDMIGLHSQLTPVYETSFVTHFLNMIFEQKLGPAELKEKVLTFMEAWSKPLPHRPGPFKAEYERFHHGPHYLLFGRDLVMQHTRTFLAELEAGRPPVRALASFCEELFVEHAHLDNKPIIVNKVPEYVGCLPILKAMFPKAKVIHCVRDGRDVACSFLARTWGPDNIADAAEAWIRLVRRGMDWGRNNADRYLEVRYEDLLRQPQTELERVLSFIGVENEAESMLEHYGRNLSLDEGRMGSWVELPTKDLLEFEEKAGDILKHFGYALSGRHPDDPDPPKKASQQAQHVADDRAVVDAKAELHIKDESQTCVGEVHEKSTQEQTEIDTDEADADWLGCIESEEESAYVEDGVYEGTILKAVCTGLIYASATSWDEIGVLSQGQLVHAAGPTEYTEGFAMVPIKPLGWVDWEILSWAELAAVGTCSDSSNQSHFPG